MGEGIAHPHVRRAIRALLNWAASEDMLDERISKRVALPKRDQKVLGILSPLQHDEYAQPPSHLTPFATPTRFAPSKQALTFTPCVG